MTKLAVLNVVGLTRSLLGSHTPNLNKFLSEGWSCDLLEPFPAVTCTGQSVMLTGTPPSEHGIVGNGWYFKEMAEVGFWKQNNGLVTAPKIWEVIRRERPDFTCANLFWWYNMYSTADWSITPRPHYPADGRKVFDVYTHPENLAAEVKGRLGGFPFHTFWGPNAGIASSRWIADAARYVFEAHQPDLNLVYLPHLDYGLQKWGPRADQIPAELAAVDAVVGELLDFYARNKVEVMIVSEYGITPVKHPVHPNRILREHGYLAVRKSLDWELLDTGSSRAFAVSDHQICHVYMRDPADVPGVARLFEREDGQLRVIHGAEREVWGLNHSRAGDVILMAKPDAWYTYYYWLDDKLAPDFARCVDIHRKPGYDPVELFFDPALKFPKAKILWTLLKKSLGFRYYMDVIPLMPELVKGSHGTPVEHREEGPLLIARDARLKPLEHHTPMTEAPMAQVFHSIRRFFSQT